MNSLGILGAFGATPPPSPARSRSASEGAIRVEESRLRRASGQDPEPLDSDAVVERLDTLGGGTDSSQEDANGTPGDALNEKAPLLGESVHQGAADSKEHLPWLLPKRMAIALISSLKAVLSAMVAPGKYILAEFYDDQGHFSILMPIHKVDQMFRRKKRRASAQAVKSTDIYEKPEKADERRSSRRVATLRGGGDNEPNIQRAGKRSPSVASSTTAVSSDSEPETLVKEEQTDGPSRHTRSKSSTTPEVKAPAKKSIRLNLHNEELRQRKQRKAKASGPSDQQHQIDPASLKSPSSPSSSKVTRYPRLPAPPRPLVPRRQPSYSLSNAPPSTHQKTLAIDLDETLIHSMAKGGRMSTGHMVEVMLSTPGGSSVPILYYVHERPHCHEFLRKAAKWYNLVVFTASVQEYADPVIEWLERERKYFAARYYRQHCTFRNGAYIKDLAQVEPDLSRVMILDNSPMSYIFHEDNAIPIEGWISDPTDNDLLYLIPLLEGLQYVTDVRALLALRLGEVSNA
ncbi:hypothetical protein B0A49_12146 [Cryomyces minteri]|uniref:FCP1 homology domain-containing protein n=2 Tax=Cryomyces minteri TaxID=331657 RepID=A0A4U0VRL7_9PEZI|nr:hypothetical protein B0A49_12146 [Cryomyces minteri]